MTELPGLRAMLSETAQRRYPRRRGHWLIPATLAAAAIAVAVALVFSLDSPEPEIEAVATPTATATVATPTPAPVVSNTAVKPLDVADLLATKAVRDDLASGGELVRAWKVPALRGNVHLIRKPDGWCISVPDPLTDQPNLERGKTCTDSARFSSSGIWVGIGSTSVSVGPAPDAPLVVQTAERRSTPPTPETTPTP